MNYKHDFKSKDNCKSCITSCSDVYIDKNDSEVQVNITAESNESTIIWGYVYDYQNRPLAGAFITLLKCVKDCDCNYEFKRICSTYSDRNGFYQFDLPENSEGQYRVVASKYNKQDKKCDKHKECNSCKRCNDYNLYHEYEEYDSYEKYYDSFNNAICDNDTYSYNCGCHYKYHNKRNCRKSKCNNICYY